MTNANPALRVHPELEGKTFLIGVGASKCATSWVHRYLGSLPGVVASPIKELHFFDPKFSRYEADPWDPLAVNRAVSYLTHAGDVSGQLRKNPTFQASIDRLAMIYDDNAYFAHFARMAAPNVETFCEITPGYAVLGVDGFRFMRQFFASQNAALKILYIMRDPVDRLWSQMRHVQQHRADLDVSKTWSDLIAKPRMIERSDYRETVEALDEVFPTDDVLYLYYEELFAPETLQGLCAFVGAPFVPVDTTTRQNETSVKCLLPGDAERHLREMLAPQYAFCEGRFGRVPDGWRVPALGL